MVQLPRSGIQHIDASSVGAYPEDCAFYSQSMSINGAQFILMRIVYEPLLLRRVTHDATIIAGYPDIPLLIFAETRDDIATQAIASSKTVEALTHGRHIIDAPIEGAYPKSTLRIAGDGIDKAVVLRLLLPQSTPGVGNGIETYQPIVAAYADSVVGAFIERVDMVSHTRREHLFQMSVAMNNDKSLVPRAQPVAPVSCLQHTQGVIGYGGIEHSPFELVLQTV